jgi:predicted MFS family arabinose efflux permease
MNRRSRKLSINTKILLLTAIMLLASSITISYFAVEHFEKKLIPELDKKTKAIGKSVSSLLIKAVKSEIPFRSLRGTDRYFASIIKDNPEIKYLAVTDLQGLLLYQGGVKVNPMQDFFKKNTAAAGAGFTTAGASQRVQGFLDNALAIATEREKLGYLHIGVDENFVQNKIKDIIYDIITVLVISFLVTFELMLFLVTYAISGPIKSIVNIMSKAAQGDFTSGIQTSSRDEVGTFIIHFNRVITWLNDSYQRLKASLIESSGSLMQSLEQNYRFAPLGKTGNFYQNFPVYIRTPLFLLIFAESLSLSFFPLFVNELYLANSLISKELVIGLPISIFMLFWALSLPSAGIWSDRIGRRKPFLIGVMLTALGLILTGLSRTVYDLLLWRAITAVGYGIVYITTQGYITDNTTAANRTTGMAMFLSGFFAGSLSGTAIGGILADRIGYRPTMFLSAGLALFSAIFVYNYLHDHKKEIKEKRKLTFEDFKILFRNRQFIIIVFFMAIPSKICLTGFLYYAGPLYLKYLGNNQSTIGRILMTYGLMMILVSPLTGKLADRLGTQSRKYFIILSGLISSLGLLIMLWQVNTFGVLLGTILIGLAHSVGVASQLSLVSESCSAESEKMGPGTVIAIFRLVERLGNISGPLISGALIVFFGYAKAIAGIGFVTLFSTLIYIFLILFLHGSNKGQLVLKPENAA